MKKYAISLAALAAIACVGTTTTFAGQRSVGARKVVVNRVPVHVSKGPAKVDQCCTQRKPQVIRHNRLQHVVVVPAKKHVVIQERNVVRRPHLKVPRKKHVANRKPNVVRRPSFGVTISAQGLHFGR